MDTASLVPFFDLEDNGRRWTVWCKVCDDGWSLGKPAKPESLHALLFHAMKHESNRVKQATTIKRNEGVDAVNNFYAGESSRGADTVAKKTQTAGSFASLDKLANLQARVYKKGEKAGVRKTSGGKSDEVTEKMASLTTPSEIAQFASEFSVPDDVIIARAKGAPNFGQFRMLMGNLARGVLNRFQKAQASPLKGKIDLADCGTVEAFTAKVRSLAPAKAPKAAKPVKAAKPAKAKKAVVAAGGAKSKQEQAKSGKGKKAKPAPRKRGEIKVVEGDDADGTADAPLAPDAVADESIA